MNAYMRYLRFTQTDQSHDRGGDCGKDRGGVQSHVICSWVEYRRGILVPLLGHLLGWDHGPLFTPHLGALLIFKLWLAKTGHMVLRRVLRSRRYRSTYL